MSDPRIEALPRLRVTGEQLDSIDPDPEKRFYVDWDEYDEFVRLDDVRAALASADDGLDVELEALRSLSDEASPGPWQWLDSGGDPSEHDELQDGGGEMVASGFREDIVLDGRPLNRDGSFAAAAANYVRAHLAAQRQDTRP